MVVEVDVLPSIGAAIGEAVIVQSTERVVGAVPGEPDHGRELVGHDRLSAIEPPEDEPTWGPQGHGSERVVIDEGLVPYLYCTR